MLRHKIITALAFLKTKFNQYTDFIKQRSHNFSEVSFDIIIICIAGFLFLYYPIGAWLTDKINRNTEVEINATNSQQSQIVDMASYLINQEVNEKIWTPNLPFFFPAAILDNMPNYQLGMINGISKFTSAFERRVDSKITNKENTSPLYKAASLLRCPGTVWMFDPHNKIKPVPSASSQYRKARRMLTKYNQLLASNQIPYYKSPQDLAFFLNKSRLNLSSSSNQLTTSIRENSTNWFDFKADDLFYYNQGKVYAYYTLLKATGADYKNVILAANQYQNWISMLKALEEACKIQPWIIRNAELSDSFAPNHLAYLNMYIQKAQYLMRIMAENLNKMTPAESSKQ